MELARFLLALGIPEVGRKTAKILAKHISEKIGKFERGEIAMSTVDLKE